MFNVWKRKILDKFGGTSTIDASIMVFGLHEFCVSTAYLVANSLKYIMEFHRTHVLLRINLFDMEEHLPEHYLCHACDTQRVMAWLGGYNHNKLIIN